MNKKHFESALIILGWSILQHIKYNNKLKVNAFVKQDLMICTFEKKSNAKITRLFKKPKHMSYGKMLHYITTNSE